MVKVQAVWTGFQGAPGYSNWYGLSDGDSAAAANALGPRMRAFFDAIKGFISPSVDIKVQREYQVVDSISGNITSTALLSADPLVVTGTSSNTSFASSAGATITWETGAYNSLGHRVRGRTYLVPLAVGSYENDGTLTSTAVSTITTAGTAALGGTGSLLVFTRPTTPTSNDGTARTVTSVHVSDKAAVLRSRRD